jgi:GH25 family lysozyme M1 (1,4-beta-N-acetylmuramidase)
VNTNVPWWLDVESDPSWSVSLPENMQFVQGALTALHNTEGVADVGIYASPGVWNSIVGNYQPSVPYWMADYLSPPSGPASCADITRWQAMGKLLPSGPLEIVQYASDTYDHDYAC